MVSVCPNHIKAGLNILDVPHVTKLSTEKNVIPSCTCAFCHLRADYKLHHDLPIKSKKKIETNSLRS